MPRLTTSLLFACALSIGVGCAPSDSEDDAVSGEAAAMTAELRGEEGKPQIVVDAMNARQAGEEATGYLGLVSENPPDDLRRTVADINIKRRAIYTNLSMERGVTVQTVARVFACVLFREKIQVGHVYRVEDGSWVTREPDEAAVVPSFCE